MDILRQKVRITVINRGWVVGVIDIGIQVVGPRAVHPAAVTELEFLLFPDFVRHVHRGVEAEAGVVETGIPSVTHGIGGHQVCFHPASHLEGETAESPHHVGVDAVIMFQVAEVDGGVLVGVEPGVVTAHVLLPLDFALVTYFQGNLVVERMQVVELDIRIESFAVVEDGLDGLGRIDDAVSQRRDHPAVVDRCAFRAMVIQGHVESQVLLGFAELVDIGKRELPVVHPVVVLGIGAHAADPVFGFVHWREMPVSVGIEEAESAVFRVAVEPVVAPGVECSAQQKAVLRVEMQVHAQLELAAETFPFPVAHAFFNLGVVFRKSRVVAPEAGPPGFAGGFPVAVTEVQIGENGRFLQSPAQVGP